MKCTLRNGCTPAPASPVRYYVERVEFDCGVCSGYIDIYKDKHIVKYTTWDGEDHILLSVDEFGTNKYLKISKGDYDDSFGYLRF